MITWQAPEFEYNSKTEWWFLGVAISACILGLIALWQKNFLFLIFVVIAAIVVIAWGKEHPKLIDFSLDDKQLRVGHQLYELKSFGAFAIKERALQFKNKARLRPFFNISAPKDRVEEIKSHLLKFLPEMDYNESLVDLFSKILRF